MEIATNKTRVVHKTYAKKLQARFDKFDARDLAKR